MATVTRADLAAAVREEAGLRKRDAAEPVDALFEAISERLAAGEPVGIAAPGHELGIYDVNVAMGEASATISTSSLPSPANASAATASAWVSNVSSS